MARSPELVLDQVYGAIADPTRRAILSVLAGGEESVGGLAGRFPISFNGVSKHVKVLERAGLRDWWYEHRGECLAIQPPSLLSFTWISAATGQQPTVVTVELLERGAHTELVLTHRRLPPEKLESHRMGWTGAG